MSLSRRKNATNGELTAQNRSQTERYILLLAREVGDKTDIQNLIRAMETSRMMQRRLPATRSGKLNLAPMLKPALVAFGGATNQACFKFSGSGRINVSKKLRLQQFRTFRHG
jgi:hypothetical protein